MSKTPRTDAIIKKYKDNPWLVGTHLAVLASELEQQLNDAIAHRDMLAEELKVVRKNLIAANKGAERNMQALNISCKKLIEARDGWKEAAYSLGEALPPSWEELQPPAEQLRKFKEMVALENEKTKKLLDNADKHSKMYP